MRSTGFSTGALAKGDFRTALQWVETSDSDAIELSALRESELPELVLSIKHLDLSAFLYRSIHAPKTFTVRSERETVDLLMPFARQGFFVVVHPDTILDPDAWAPLGRQLCIENMDARKNTGRTVEELAEWFKKLPDASLCLDLGHARHVDPTMCEAIRLILHFGDRIAQVHVSEVDTAGNHVAMSRGCADVFRSLAGRVRKEAAVIVESQVGQGDVDHELRIARDATA